jgi:hypothetical protein
MKQGFIGIAILLFAFAHSSANGPELENLRLIRSVETAVFKQMREQDSLSGYVNSGGVSGGTHIGIGCALIAAGVILGGSLSSVDGGEGNLATHIITILAPAAVIGGAAEIVYGIVKAVRTKNEFD